MTLATSDHTAILLRQTEEAPHEQVAETEAPAAEAAEAATPTQPKKRGRPPGSGKKQKVRCWTL